jgi:ABC-2 type transport system permease protein
MYNFWVQSYSTYRGLFAWLNWPGYISGTIVQPFATVIMYAVLGRFASNPEAIRTYSLGIAVVSMAFILIAGLTQSYQYDRTYGTISFLFVSPANRLVNFLSRSVLHFPNGLLSFALGMVAAWLIVGLNFSSVNWPGFILAVIVISISITAFGQLLGVISIANREWVGVQGVANGILLILCGAIIPLSVFPGFVQEVAKLLPITNGLIAIRDSFTGVSLADFSGNILREAIIALAYYLVAYLGFGYFEHYVKKAGTLERDAI